MNTSVFKDFIELAKEYRDLARNNGYIESFEDEGKYVRCYFADESDYAAVTIGCFDMKIHIGFHSTAHFSDLTLNSILKLEDLYVKYVNYLAELKERFDNRSENEIESDRQKSIRNFKDRLEEMENAE